MMEKAIAEGAGKKPGFSLTGGTGEKEREVANRKGRKTNAVNGYRERERERSEVWRFDREKGKDKKERKGRRKKKLEDFRRLERCRVRDRRGKK